MSSREVLLQYAILCTVTIAGLVMMIAGVHYGNAYVKAIADTLMTSGILGVLYQALMGKYQDKRLMDMLRVHESVHASGLLEYHERDKGFSFSGMIKDSESLIIVVRDGLTWCKTNADFLRFRFGRKTRTQVYMLDHDGAFVSMIAQRVGSDAATYASKLKTAQDELTAAYRDSDCRGTLEIFKLKTFPAQSVFLSEKTLVVTMYQTSSKRMSVPLLVYDAADQTKLMTRFVKDDLEACADEATLHARFVPDRSNSEGFRVETPP